MTLTREDINRANGISYMPAAVEEPPPVIGRQLTAESFAAIRAERTRWLWDGRIPLGAATLLVGREKLGKSTLTCELAARLSRGNLDGALAGQPTSSLLVSFEDSAARTIKPRLLAADADVTLVRRVKATDLGAEDLLSLPLDAEAIGQLAEEHHARLLVVDPFSASLTADIDGHRDQHIRRAIAPLVAIAERHDLALVLVAHWSKGTSGDPLSRVLGSRGLTAAVRSVLAFGVDPEADEGTPERVVVNVANNLAPEASSLGARIEPRVIDADDVTLETSRLVLGDEVTITAADLLVTRTGEDRSQADEAADWLADELADGEWHAARDLKAAAKAAGHSDKAVRTARERLGVEADREGFASRGGGQSRWRLALVPSALGTNGHERGGHERENPVNTGDSGGTVLRSCLSPREGTNGPDWTLATDEEEALADQLRAIEEVDR